MDEAERPAEGPEVTQDGVGENAAQGKEIMPFDDGSVVADKAQSSAMNLVVNYAEPLLAAGVAVFGLGLLVLPLLARINEVERRIYAYERHGETNKGQKMRLFTEAEMKQRLGLLDPEFLEEDITRSTDEMDEYMNASDIDSLEAEVNKMQKWRDGANANLKGLQKRSALAFLGLPPDASDNDISKMYKKMALELHPDKGGDPEAFQELQEMKERLNDIEADEKKTDEEKADEEELKKKEKEQEEEEDKKKLPPDERVKKLRMDIHENTLRLWERANKSRDEIVGEKAVKANAQPALNILRLFVERFVNSEVKTLRHDDTKSADAKFRKFVKQGAEIIAVAALHDVQSTLQTISMQFNYRLVARSGSPEIHRRCKALLEAIAEVPAQSEAFIKRVDDAVAGSKDRDKKTKEDRAQEQREREEKGDFSGEAGAAAQTGAADKAAAGGTAQAKASAKAAAAAAKAVASAASKAASPDGVPGAAQGKVDSGAPPKPDPFGDFDFEPAPRPKATPAKASAAAPAKAEALAKRRDDERASIAEAVKPKRTTWDPSFDHPYAGALKANGQGIYCRPCQRWVSTFGYDTEAFLTHVERVHPKPPLGW